MSTAIPTRVFMNGNSQAVRIPQEFRLETSDVEISRTAAGDLIIRPMSKDRGAAFLEVLDGFDDTDLCDFIEKLEDARKDDQTPQERDDM